MRSVPKRQAQYFFGRLAARAALRVAGVSDWEIRTGPSREPVWPEFLSGSITHSDSLAAAIVVARAHHEFAGIDIEDIVSDAGEAALRATVLDELEIALLSEASHALDLRARMTIAFSAKESLFKGLFPQVNAWFGFDTARVSAFEPHRSRIRLALASDLTPRLCQNTSFDLSFQWLTAKSVFTSLLA